MGALLAARILFTRHWGRLLVHASELGLDVIQGECLRGEYQAKWNASHCKVHSNGKRCEQIRLAHDRGALGHSFAPIGIGTSLHVSGLAGDLLVMRDGKIVEDLEPYRLLGEWWEAQFEAAAWGGRFRDPGHFSHAFGGRK